MRKLYINILITACLIAFQSCSHTEYEEPDRDEIYLSSQWEGTLSTETRAVGNFPGDGTIGLLAATSYDPANPQYTNWRAYSDINNAKATVEAVTSGVYSFSWQEKKYWPFDGSDLYFLAYSPYTNATSNTNYVLQDDGNTLYIAMNGNVPDVMVASGNTNPQPYNKTDVTLDLGTFQHALSRLLVYIIADKDMPASIKATGLTVTTTAINGTLDLTAGADAMDVTISQNTPVNISLVSGSVDFKEQSISRSQLLFAGTEQYTILTITLVDTATNSTFNRSYNISSFVNEIPNEPITLQRGKNTILRFIVSVVNVENPEGTLQLQGIITDWNDQGSYGVTIQ